jgi:hypothetical protein
METKCIPPERLSEILEDNAESRIQASPRLAYIRHRVKALSLQDAVLVHIEQTSNSSFKVIKGFPNVGVRLNSHFGLCTIRGGHSRELNPLGRLQSYAALLVEDDSGNRFCLTLDAIGDFRSPWTGWLSLHSLLGLTSSPPPEYRSLQLGSPEPDPPKPDFLTPSSPKLDLDSLKLLSLESEFLAA